MNLGATGLYLSGLATMGGLFLAMSLNGGSDPDASMWDMIKERVDANEMFCEVDGDLGPVIRETETGDVVYAAFPESRAHARVQSGYNMDVGEGGQRCEVQSLGAQTRIFDMNS